MRLPLSLLQILFLTWVSSIEHYWVILAERRGSRPYRCHLAQAKSRTRRFEQLLRLPAGAFLFASNREAS